MQNKMSHGKRKTIYGMATQLGIYQKGNENDDLHAIVHRVTRKGSISQLTDEEADLVVGELVKLKRENRALKARKNPDEYKQKHRSGMINPNQEKAVWFYMYRLEELDSTPSQKTRTERLCAIIEKYLHVSAYTGDPFRFVSFANGSILIEVLKKMVRHEKLKAEEKSTNG
ncbi:hypothetical protein Dtox_4217 [Desulfofarcimen acetoxidans DSM 771]|uniref:Regulatory protein GemA n=1 Tax=Desulfofarcimen acetoxidans (strain ATCC 49208 / DSM 771 / KCTC 5769 / VKM B-1644 / 5575) TaxID=485916 RepID=C8VZD9_DESAS|nr:phage protein GemA/Gp16 family protein [Desulfofarcimen acetoxidans]ACV64884.1 hypothetical protein Dtox_4217 [Desulfofarcimen acetoxidans DSM 771]